MGPFSSLCLLSLVMCISTFFFGQLPLTLRLSRLTLRILEVAGAGLLLGAACSVVLPEGAGTIFREEGDTDHAHHDHRRRAYGIMQASGLVGWEPENLLAVAFLSGVLLMFIIDQIMSPGAHSHQEYQHHDEEHHSSSAFSSSSSATSPSTTAAPHLSHPRSQSLSVVSHQHSSQDTSRQIRRLTRPETLLLTRSSSVIEAAKGYSASRGSQRFDGLPDASPHSESITNDAIMSVKSQPDSAAGSEIEEPSLPADYETFSQSQNGYSAFRENGNGKSSITLSSAHIGGALTSDSGDDPALLRHTPVGASDVFTTTSDRRHGGRRRQSGSDSARPKDEPRGLRRAFTSILGLIIHAACDGIAMGASSASKDEGLKLVVVGAIMIHKAPAAFGLCSLLLSQRLSRQDIRRAMGIFSLATPVGAIVTYLLLSIFFTSDSSLATSDGSNGISSKHIGSALIFSGGSFLYVALDAVHELASYSADVYTVWQETSSPLLVHVQRRGRGEEEEEEEEEEFQNASDEHDDGGGETSDFTGNEDEDEDDGDGEQQPQHASHRRQRRRRRPRRRRLPRNHRGVHLIAIQSQTLGRTGRILVLIIGALLPRTLQSVFGHGH